MYSLSAVQVDLKDKWRNLERQGIVGPQDLPPQPVPQLQGQVQVHIIDYNSIAHLWKYSILF